MYAKHNQVDPKWPYHQIDTSSLSDRKENSQIQKIAKWTILQLFSDWRIVKFSKNSVKEGVYVVISEDELKLLNRFVEHTKIVQG